MARVAAENRLAGRTVLITGASGFIGSHLARRLLEHGARVHVLSRSGTPGARLRDVAGRLTAWRGDVTNAASCAASVGGAQPEIIVHLAADTTARKFDSSWDAVNRSVAVNLLGTLNMLRAAVESAGPISMFLRVGGLEEYGTAAIPFDEDARERPSSPYSASQVAGTHYAQMLQRHVPFAIVTLRPALLYGPDQSLDFFIPALIDSCLRGRPFEMSSGTQYRELLYIDDAIEALCITAARSDLAGEIINIGHGREYTVREIGEQIAQLIGTPELLRIGPASTRPGELAHLVSRTTHARRLLEWAPRVELREGLMRTIDWYRTSTRRQSS